MYLSEAQRQLLTRINRTIHICGRKKSNHIHAIRWKPTLLVKLEVSEYRPKTVPNSSGGRYVCSWGALRKVPSCSGTRAERGTCSRGWKRSRGWRGSFCRALCVSWQEHGGAVGAVVSWLDSLWLPSCAPPACLPVLMSILPTGGFLWSVVGAG